MWSDWLCSLTGPSSDTTSAEVPEPIETPRRFSNPHSIEKLQSLQIQHQELQVQQLHLLNKQFQLQKELGDACESTCTEGGSSAPQSPSSGVSSTLAEAFKSTAGVQDAPSALSLPKCGKVPNSFSGNGGSKFQVKTEQENEKNMDSTCLPTEVWQQFHAIQAQQWAQALNQARLAKRHTTGVPGMGGPIPLTGGHLGVLSAHVSGGSGLSGGKRCKAYAAPKGVWKNNGGYNATIYVHKRRIYGPIRRDLSDAIEDRKEMEEALRELTAVHNSPEDAAVLEVEMREVVAGLRNRSTPNRIVDSVPGSRLLNSQGTMLATQSVVTPGEGSRKRLRLVGTTSVSPDTPLQIAQEVMASLPSQSPDVLGPFAAPMQIKDELNLHYDDNHYMGELGMDHDNSNFGSRVGYTPNVGPMRDVYPSPGDMLARGFGGGLDDHHLDMLPDPLGGGNMWGSH